MTPESRCEDKDLTLDLLLSDPLTRLVMRSDRITPADMARAFFQAEAALVKGRREGLPS